jgi:hypothetical protein
MWFVLYFKQVVLMNLLFVCKVKFHCIFLGVTAMETKLLTLQ